MSPLVILTIFCVLVNSTLAAKKNFGSPSLKWIPDSLSEHGIPLLNVKFPDGLEDDFAVLRKTEGPPSKRNCKLEGHLMFEKNASVRITKGCELSEKFEIDIESSRLVYFNFDVEYDFVEPERKRAHHGEQSTFGHGNQLPPYSPEHGLVLRLLAFYDASFKSKFQKGSRDLVETILEGAQDIFSHPSLTLNIQLELVDTREINEIISSNDPNLCQIVERNTNYESINNYIFFTAEEGIGFRGRPREEYFCPDSPRKVAAVVQWLDNVEDTSKSLAHELGHLQGMGHDFEWNADKTNIVIRTDSNGRSCSDSNGVMDLFSDQTVWSTCSSEDFLNARKTTSLPTGFSKVAVALGRNNDNLDVIEVIDLSSTSTRCQNLPDFPFKNYWAVGGLGFGDNPIICGGDLVRSTSCHSLMNDAWKPVSSLQEGRSQFAMSRSPFPNSGSKLFITGGDGPQRLNSSEVLTKNGWETSVPLPDEISKHCMVLFNPTSVMVIGGVHELRGTSRRTFTFDGVTSQWSAGPPLRHRRSSHSCAMIRKNAGSHEKTIIVVGGHASKKTLQSTEILDAGSLTWRSGPELPFKAESGVLVEDPSGGVVFIGGYTLQGNKVTAYDKLFKLAHAGSDVGWQEMPQKLKTARRFHTAFLIPDELARCSKATFN